MTYKKKKKNRPHKYIQSFSKSSEGRPIACGDTCGENTIKALTNGLLKDMHDAPEEVAQILEENLWDLRP
ncbi:hypothetical protein KAR91_26530 [Candidatus Pacearchaeota archaeon]|nr:hypothetical protein [Candidatus Pacearchaeota archaeon]